LVVSTSPLKDLKSVVKTSHFALRKIEEAKHPTVLLPEFMRMTEKMAAYFVTEPGAILLALTFAQTLNDGRPVPTIQKSTVPPDTTVLQAEESERLTVYKNMVRESFARDASTLIVVPTIADAERIYAALSHGIEQRVFMLSSDMGAAALKNAWGRILGSPKAVLVIGTPPALSLPRHFETIVIEREAAPAWRGRESPHLDYRRAAELLAHETGAACVLADFPIRVESRARIEFGEVDEHYRPQARPLSRALVTVIDPRVTDQQKKERRTFHPLSAASREAITTALNAKQRAVIVASRRGLSSVTICNACGTPVTDAAGTPMTLTRSERGNVFVSRRTGEIRDSALSCATCGNWDLVTLGLGVERIHEYILKTYPQENIFLITADSAPTHRTAKRIAERIMQTPAAIVIGTERMLPYLTECHTSIALVDPLFAASSWRSDERALLLLTTLQSKTTDHMLIETRRIDSHIVRTVVEGTPLAFYRAERELRETYHYPPFTTFIGLTWSGTPAECDALAAQIRTTFADADVVGPLPREQIKKNEWRERAVIRVPRDRWPDHALDALIRALPRHVHVVVDPDDIV
jgi:primosomal protein N'